MKMKEVTKEEGEPFAKKDTVERSKIMIVLLIYLFCIALIGKDKYDHSERYSID